MNEHARAETPAEPATALAEIKSYFAVLANCEQLSLTDTEGPGVLCLKDITEIGGKGLDLVEDLQQTLQAAGPQRPAVRNKRDPLEELRSLEIDRVVTVYLHAGLALTGSLCESPDDRVILFEPKAKKGSFHQVPYDAIAAWSDVRGENSDPLFLFDGQFLTASQIQEKEAQS